MNIEELTKSQLILLTVLVNFVTSIATGILTVSLLDQAPPVVTQTINRIVEHTVETVAAAAPAAVIQAPKPSVEDLITAAFAADEARKVSIYALATGTSTDPVAIGTYLPKSRVIAAMKGDGLPKEALIMFSNGLTASSTILRGDDTLALYSFPENLTLPSAPALTLIGAGDLKLGQTALALLEGGNAATGIVSKVKDMNIGTSLPLAPLGAAAVDLSGNLIGLSTGIAGQYISADRIKALLSGPAATSTATHN